MELPTGRATEGKAGRGRGSKTERLVSGLQCQCSAGSQGARSSDCSACSRDPSMVISKDHAVPRTLHQTNHPALKLHGLTSVSAYSAISWLQASSWSFQREGVAGKGIRKKVREEKAKKRVWKGRNTWNRKKKTDQIMTCTLEEADASDSQSVGFPEVAQ